MKDLIEALTILSKYVPKKDQKWPTHCEHDILMVMAVREVDEEDIKRLQELSFRWNEDRNCWTSYRFGSC